MLKICQTRYGIVALPNILCIYTIKYNACGKLPWQIATWVVVHNIMYYYIVLYICIENVMKHETRNTKHESEHETEMNDSNSQLYSLSTFVKKIHVSYQSFVCIHCHHFRV